MKIPNDMIRGTIHSTNRFGDLEVISYKSNSHVRVRFIETGYETISRSYNIRIGSLKDLMLPAVHGFGYPGVGCYSISNSPQAYEAWRGMISRCYCKKRLDKYKTYIGCSVCDEWRSFQVFAKWFSDNYTEGLHLDKDIRVKGNKVYSPDTCKFVTRAENVIEAHAKNYKLISPEGNVVEIYNMSAFARDNDLSRGQLLAVARGATKTHKGWTSPA